MAAIEQAPQPRPSIVRFVEMIAAILELRDGRLELVYRGGRLEAWATDSGLHRPSELARYDGAADQLLNRAA